MKGISLLRAEEIKTTELFNSGAWFTAREIGTAMGMDYHKVMGALANLRKDGFAESRRMPGVDGQFWRKRKKIINPLNFRWTPEGLGEALSNG